MTAKRALTGLGALLMGASVAVLLAMRLMNSSSLSLPNSPAPQTTVSATPPATASPLPSASPRASHAPQSTPEPRPSPVQTRVIQAQQHPTRPRPAPHRPVSVQSGIVSIHYPSSVEVVRLKYADVSDVAAILSNKSEVAGTASSSGAERISENLAIDRSLNAAILSGEPDVVANLRAMIARLDVLAPSVRLDCEVVELTRSGAEHAGVDYASSGALASTQLLGVTGGSLARVFAEIQAGNGKLLATPLMVAINGKPVSITDGEAVNAGVHLRVQPRVSADGKITSHIVAEFSNVTAEKADVLSTTATAAEGQPFVVGGFFRIVERDSVRRTPLLGYIPLIGSLFRVRHRTLEDTNLYIIITPHIVR